MKIEKYLLLNLKKVFLIIEAFILAVLLHNLIYALFYDYFTRTGGDEPVFFIIAVIIIPLYFLAAVGYTTFYHIRKKVKNKK